MTTFSPSDCILCDTLSACQTIAVVGLSPDRERASYDVADYLQRAGYRILPVNPKAAGGEILGEPVYASLAAIADAGIEVQMVDIFRRSEAAGAVVDDAIAALGARGLRGVWLQLGVIDAEAVARAERAGLLAVMDLCLKIEHRRLAQAGCEGLSAA